MFIYLLLLLTTATALDLDLSETEAQEVKEIISLISQDEEFTQLTEACSPQIAEETKQTQSSSITISNNIAQEALVYKHWSGTYTPEQFTISVNGNELQQGEKIDVCPENGIVTLGYTYSFHNGMRTGGKKVEYKLNENTAHSAIGFSWKDDWRILLDNATAIKEIKS